MPLLRSRLAALATALLLPAAAHAGGPELKFQRSIVASPASASAELLPVFIDADRLEGVSDKESTAEGNAEVRKGSTSIKADMLKYYNENEDVDARGNVRIDRAGDVLTGPALRYRMKDSTGVFEKPDYSLAPRARQDQIPISGRGRAESIEFAGEDNYRIKDGTFTTCAPGSDDWHIEANELDLDFTRQVGTARDATLVFKGFSGPKLPSFDFSLNNQRKSGFLPPSFGTTGKGGLEFTAPYYFNLAPNYDLTVTPRYMAKRGLQLGEEFRYIQPNYNGIFRADVLPHDQASNLNRSSQSLFHTYSEGPVTAGLNLNRVSDDNYFRDFGTRINVTSQTYLIRDRYVGYSGPWLGTGGYGLTARVQNFQTLQDPLNPVPIQYSREPQLTLSANRPDLRGLDVAVSGEYVDFEHPVNVIGRRTTLYPSVTMPRILPGAFLTPKMGLHATHYELERVAAGTPDSIDRTVPIFSLDSGLVFEREAQMRGQSFTQTLEPRAYYLRVPFRDQSQIPLFDTGLADFNYAQIFSENSFAGGDRINDANQLTLAVSSRLLAPATGQEVIRATIGQRYYFEDQQVMLNSTDVPRAYRSSDWLAALSGRIAPKWIADAAMEYNPRENRSERLTVSTRYQPEALKTFNVSYRYLRDQITQVDTSAQWPLGGRWFGVGRFNYSLRDKRVVEGLGGFEYGADCWIGRIVLQRFALTVGASTSA
ncbi:MAG: LPS-assembly protein LptD, partial [Burkholderiales bacterium]